MKKTTIKEIKNQSRITLPLPKPKVVPDTKKKKLDSLNKRENLN